MFDKKVERISLTDSLAGGYLLALGVWYLYRPFLLENFPQIAPGVSSAGDVGELGGKLIVLTVSAIVASVFLAHTVDILIPLIVGGTRYLSKRQAALKRAATVALYLFVLPERDPRVVAINRYLNSSRREWFLAMVRTWAHSDESRIAHDEEKVLVHQHIVSRLRAISDAASNTLEDAYRDVMFAGSIFAAFLALVPLGVLSVIINSTVIKARTPHTISLLTIMFTLYALTVVSGIFFKRRLRTFFSQIITFSLHYYDVSLATSPSVSDTVGT